MRSMVEGVPLALVCVGPPPSVAFGATFPRKREKDPDCEITPPASSAGR